MLSSLESRFNLDLATVLRDWQLHEYRTYQELSNCVIIFRHSVEHPYLNNRLKSVDFIVYDRYGQTKLILECKYINLPKFTSRRSILKYPI